LSGFSLLQSPPPTARTPVRETRSPVPAGCCLHCSQSLCRTLIAGSPGGQFPCGRQVTLCIACTTTFTDFLQARLQGEAQASKPPSTAAPRVDSPSTAGQGHGTIPQSAAAVQRPTSGSSLPAVRSPVRNRSTLANLRPSPLAHVVADEAEVRSCIMSGRAPVFYQLSVCRAGEAQNKLRIIKFASARSRPHYGCCPRSPKFCSSDSCSMRQ